MLAVAGHSYARGMARLSVIAAVLALLAGCATSSASSGQARTASNGPACGPRTAKTLAASPAARVYVVNHVVYGCSGRTHRRTQLGSDSICQRTRVGPFALSGQLLAYGSESCGVDTGSSEVVIRRLSDGKTLASTAAMTQPLGVEAFSEVDSIVVNGAGAAAWIASGGSIVQQGNRHAEVHKLLRGSATLLDSGSAIVTHSLRLHGSTISWRDGAITKTSSL